MNFVELCMCSQMATFALNTLQIGKKSGKHTCGDRNCLPAKFFAAPWRGHTRFETPQLFTPQYAELKFTPRLRAHVPLSGYQLCVRIRPSPSA
jgi:hypothetical protein